MALLLFGSSFVYLCILPSSATPSHLPLSPPTLSPSLLPSSHFPLSSIAFLPLLHSLNPQQLNFGPQISSGPGRRGRNVTPRTPPPTTPTSLSHFPSLIHSARLPTHSFILTYFLIHSLPSLLSFPLSFILTSA